MRGTLSILITVLICAVVLILYLFLGRGQVTKQIREVEAQQQSTRQQLAKISEMRAKLPVLMKQLPQWKDRLALYKQAIPEPINDDDFLSLLAKQLKAQDVQLLSVDVSPQGKWLGEIGEDRQDELRNKGIDPKQAGNVMSAMYTINLLGKFDHVLAAFENMKRYRRLYTIDEVSSPSGGAPGAITQVVDPDILGIQVKGRIYYGIKDDYLSNADLIKVFESAVIKPLAKRMQSEIVSAGQGLLESAAPAETTESQTQDGDEGLEGNIPGRGPAVAGRSAGQLPATQEG